jgi:hypothetical protein
MNQEDAPSSPNYRRPGRPGLTQTQVDQAADALLQQGRRPSIEKIRHVLGGSPATIAPLLDDWWRRLAARVRVGPEAFQRLPGSLAQIAEAFFLHALEEARRTVRKEERREREAFEHEQHSVQVRSHVLSLREQELQSRLDDRERTSVALELQLREQTLLLRKLQASRDAAVRRIEHLEGELARVQQRARPKRPPRPAATAKKPPASKRRKAKRGTGKPAKRPRREAARRSRQ